MNVGRSRQSGYTIVETIIFLAVSGAMAVAVIVLIGGQQRRTEFQTSVREFQLELQDLANDVSTGFFSLPPDATDGRCRGTPSGVYFDMSPTDSHGCVLVGRLIQFKNESDGTYNLYTVVGKKDNDSGASVSSLDEAMPLVMAGGGNIPNSKIIKAARNATIEQVEYRNGSAGSTIGSLGFFTTFHRSGARGLASGASRVNVVPVNTTALTDSDGTAISKTNDTANLAVQNPIGGVKMCLRSQSTSQHAIISLGADQAGSLTVNSEILEGAACPTSLF